MHFGNHIDDDALLRAEQELKELVHGLPPQDEPSQAYWDMLATRTMARVHREEDALAAPTLWRRFWIPGSVVAAAAMAVFVFMLTRAVEPTLDTATAQLPAADVQELREAEAPLVPVGVVDAQVTTELVTKVTERHADLDAVLAFADIEPSQLSTVLHDSPLGSEAYDLDDVNDDDDATLVGLLKNSM